MDVFDFAILKEKETMNTYLELINKYDDPGYKNTFRMLAGDEQKHINMLTEMKNSNKASLDNIHIEISNKYTFQEMGKESLRNIRREKDIYISARNAEKLSEHFYRHEADSTNNKSHKKTLTILAEEEVKHFNILDNIIELVEHPEQWAESAEFNHVEQY